MRLRVPKVVDGVASPGPGGPMKHPLVIPAEMAARPDTACAVRARRIDDRAAMAMHQQRNRRCKGNSFSKGEGTMDRGMRSARVAGVGSLAFWMGLVAAMALLPVSPGIAKAVANGREVVTPLFGIDHPSAGPFPADRYTLADPSQNTCERVSVPKSSDCVAERDKCWDLDQINEMDGFNLRPRVAIPFSGPIDLASVNSATVFFVSVGDTLVDGAPDCLGMDGEEDDREDSQCRHRRGSREGWTVGINQAVWEPTTNTLYAKADEMLDQHTRYLLIVTRGVRDASGAPIAASDAFRRLHTGEHGASDFSARLYLRSLRHALHHARAAGVRHEDVAVASLFTTASVTSALVTLRNQIAAAPAPAPVDFRI